MKQNMIVFGLIASAGFTFCRAPKATAFKLQLKSYTGNGEDGDEEEVDTGK